MGNVGNASPAADGVPVLLALQADVELASATGVRRLPLSAFITGNRTTARHPDELVTAIHVPDDGSAASSAFLKLGSRSSLVISIVMVGGALRVDADGAVTRASIAVGACSPVARRLASLEARLVGSHVADDDAWSVGLDDIADLSPIDDVRGTAVYRSEAAVVLVQLLLDELRR